MSINKRGPIAEMPKLPPIWMRADEAAALSGMTVDQLKRFPMDERRVRVGSNIVSHFLSADVVRICKVKHAELRLACIDPKKHIRARALATVATEVKRLEAVRDRSVSGYVLGAAMECLQNVAPKRKQR